MEQNLLPETPKEKLLKPTYKPSHPRNKNTPKIQKQEPTSDDPEESPGPKPSFRPPGGMGFGGMFPAGFDPTAALKNLKKADDKG